MYNGVTLIQADKNDLTEVITKIMSKRNADIIARHRNKLVGVTVACQVLDISANTLYRYVKERRIINRSDLEKKMLFDLGELLELDIQKGKHVRAIERIVEKRNRRGKTPVTNEK